MNAKSSTGPAVALKNTSRISVTLSYKRLYNAPDRWRLEHSQHLQLGRFPWIYYALSEVRTIHESRNALHLLRIVQPQRLPLPFPLSSCKIEDLDNNGVRYARWGGFALGLAQCHFGYRADTPQELHKTFAEARDLGDTLVDIYFMSLGSRRILVRSSPFVTGFDDQEGFDFGFESDDLELG